MSKTQLLSEIFRCQGVLMHRLCLRCLVLILALCFLDLSLFWCLFRLLLFFERLFLDWLVLGWLVVFDLLSNLLVHRCCLNFISFNVIIVIRLLMRYQRRVICFFNPLDWIQVRAYSAWLATLLLFRRFLILLFGSCIFLFWLSWSLRIGVVRYYFKFLRFVCF